MWEWIQQKWLSDWLGNIVWWQSFAALIQAAFGVFLMRLTKQSVDLSRSLTKAQTIQIQLQTLALKRELYEKRIAIYKSVLSHLNQYQQQPLAAVRAPLQAFPIEVLTEADFLFDEEVESLLCQIQSKSEEYQTFAKEKRALAHADDDVDQQRRKLELISELNAIGNWMTDTANLEARKRFRKYLDLRDDERGIDSA